MKSGFLNNKIFNKFLSFSIGNWLGLIISLISTPIITRILSPEEFGTFSLFLISINLFSLICIAGIDQSFARFYYENDFKENQRNLYLGLIFASALYLFVCLIIFLTKEYSLPILLGSTNESIIIIFLLTLILSIFNRYNFMILRMEQRAKLYSTLQVAQKIVDFSMFLMIYFVFTVKLEGLTALVISYFIATFTIFITGLLLNRKMFNLNIKDFSIKDLKNLNILLAYGIPLALTVLITWLFQFIDRIMLSYYVGNESVGIYAAAFKFIAIINIIQTSFTTFWFPVSTQKYLEGNNNLFFEKVFKIVLFSMLLLGVIVIIFKDFLLYFFGPGYEDSVNLVALLILIPIMYTLSEITVVGVNFAKKVKWHIYISIIVCVINILGNYILIPLYGVNGAALSTAMAYIIYFFLRTYVGMKFYKFKVFSIYNTFSLLIFILFCIMMFDF